MTIRLLLACLLLIPFASSANAQEDKRDDPKNAINQELIQIIRQLRREVESLRKEVGELKERLGDRDRPRSEADRVRRPDPIRERPRYPDSRTDKPRREGDRDARAEDREDMRSERDRLEKERERRERSDRYGRTEREKPNSITPPDEDRRSARSSERRPDIRKWEKIFVTYDKDKNGKVSFSEWLAMKEGKMTDERARREKEVFSKADRNRDEQLSFAEFYSARTRKSVPDESGKTDRKPESKRDEKTERRSDKDR